MSFYCLHLNNNTNRICVLDKLHIDTDMNLCTDNIRSSLQIINQNTFADSDNETEQHNVKNICTNS